MLRHGSLRFFRLLIGHCREDLKVLVVAVIEHDQELIIPLDAGLIDLLNGLQAGEQDRVMRRAGKIIMERAVVFKMDRISPAWMAAFSLPRMLSRMASSPSVRCCAAR